jgi:dTDP-glucose 4,6-dehydratase
MLTNSKSKVVFQDLPQDDPMMREPDVSRAIELFNWNPKVKRKEGLQKSIDYFRNQVGAK